mmetsp:Transcript_3199/g.7109  ORF Transcript_3199/g.7109 Transcript_3199/m.7109 type:complete len:297 (+) Transcript_3199:58-948(+)
MPLCISGLVFGLGPRINAAGRVDHARSAVQLLLAKDLKEAAFLADKLDAKNNLRKGIDRKTTEEALAMIQAKPEYLRAKTTVLFKDSWHKGVVGIVASRCLEQYYRPTVILTEARGKATGSARSVAGYNIFQALEACADLLDQYGGHAYAAGLTLSLSQVEAFQQLFEQVVTDSISVELLVPPQEVDLPLQFEDIDSKFCNVLKQMAPFGAGNRKAIFVTDNVFARSCTILKGQHLKLHVHQQDSKHVLEAIGFGLAHYEPLVRSRKPFRMVYTVEEKYYLAQKSLQLNVKDMQSM